MRKGLPYVQPGTLRHVVTLEEKSSALDSWSEDAGTWSTVATLRAFVEPLAGREAEAARQIRADLTHRVVVRSIPGRKITPADRLKFEGRTLEIVEARDVAERGREVVLLCTEKVTRGE